MELGINDIVLTYEHLDGFEYKLNITLFIVTKYIQATTGATEFYARKKAMEMRDPILGWALVMERDDRFYEWCKRRFYAKAISKKSKNKHFVMLWLDENENVQRDDYNTKASANEAYRRKALQGHPVAVFIRQTNGELRGAPIWRNKAEPLLYKAKDLINKYGDDGKSAVAARCRKNREVKSCKMCCRYVTCDMKEG